MDKRDAFYDIIKELVSADVIRDIVRKEVREKLETYSMEKAIRDTAMELIYERGDAWIHEMINDVLNGQVRIDDGWGNVKEEGTFEDYVRRALRRQCFDQWNIERKLREAVDEKLKKIAKDIVQRHLQEDLVDEVLGELAGEAEGKKA